MYAMNLSPTATIIEFTALIMFPAILWCLYKYELYREKKELLRQIQEVDRTLYEIL